MQTWAEAVPDEAARRLRALERLSWILDRSIPLGRWRIGIDPIIGLIPGIGDWLGTALSLYVVYQGARLGVSGPVVARMVGNVALEATVGAIPLLGDLFDFAWQANTRNMDLIKRHYHPGRRPRSLRRVTLAVLMFAVLILAALSWLAYLIIKALAAWLLG